MKNADAAGHNSKDDSLVRQCMNFFLCDATLKMLLEGFLDKYTSLGHAGGNVVINKLNPERIEALEGLLGKNYHGKGSASISAEKVQKALDQSRFKGVRLEMILQEYNDGELKSRKEQKQEQEKREEAFFAESGARHENTLAAEWLKEIVITHEPPYMAFLQKYRENEEAAAALLQTVLEAINKLPVLQNEYRYLPVFATSITGDPHYFDEGRESLNALFYGIAYYIERHSQGKNVINAAGLSKTEQRQEILLAAGILKGDISNNTICYGIRGINKDHKEHRGIEGFFRSREAVLLTLRAILDLETVLCEGEKIYVMENPSIFSELTGSGTKRRNTQERSSYLCISGQPNLASLLLLDKIAASGNRILYGGDFDPEGLMIADHLKQRYGEILQFWNMNKENYHMSLSNKKLADRRLKMLDKLQDDTLRGIAEEMRKIGKAGYQEKILDRYR